MRISTTAIESFRLWSDPNQEWMPESELIETITGVFTPTPKMLLGQAFGRCLEKPAKYRVPNGYDVPVKCGDRWITYHFSDDVMGTALAVFDPRGVFETKLTKQYGQCTVVAKVDQMFGTTIVENKAKLSTFDFNKYAASCQWRFYLDVFEGATSVKYNVFLFDDGADDGEYRLRGIESFQLYPYAGLHQDCRDLVRRFVEYAQARQLDGFLRERQEIFEKEYSREFQA